METLLRAVFAAVHKIIKGQFGLPDSFGTDPYVWYNMLVA
jgi:hypothetical protein